MEPKANVYLIRQIESDVRQKINKLGKCIEAQIPEAQLQRSELHHTMIYDLERDVKMEKKWQEETEGQKMEIISQHIIIGKQRAALSIPECEFVKNGVM